ncbi:acid protease [Auricularia subglabra TFB-10046 SS5]|uniref:Acid protease n=1 Tax=Auricularia subglabra (strain TFB-10046 / SS5) TaxID=717982 RepID=J0CX47_AURST|nr:acid protease [Auricularia subglabra TFB-10046 SS5]
MLPSISCSLALAGAAYAALTVPLERRATSRPASAERFQAMASSLRVKYGAKGSKAKRQSEGGISNTIALSDLSLDSSYSAQLEIGTPPQTFSVIMDTGSSDLWLAGPDCTSCEMETYDTTASSTFVTSDAPVRISYGSGQARGTIAADKVTMGGFSIAQQTMAVVHSLTEGLKVNNVSGLMGLGFTSIATTKSTPFWLTLVQQGAWAQPVMGFYMTRWLNQPNAQAVEFGGLFTMGGTNTSIYTGDVDFITLPAGTQGGFWNIPVVSVGLLGQEIKPSTDGSTVMGAIDTGTTLIGAPPAFVSRFYTLIEGAQPGTGSWDGFYLYPCATQVNLTLNFGSRTWSVSNDDFALMQVTDEGESSLCAGGLFDIDTGGNGAPDWIVGATFLKNVYSVFRSSPPSVGFATLANPGDPTGAEVRGTSGAARAMRSGSALALAAAVLLALCA